MHTPLPLPRPQLTQERLQQLLDYDPLTGAFRWRSRRRQMRITIGDIAGCHNGKGSWRIGLEGREYLAHRLAWFYVHGEWPNAEIDHINGDGTDNRIKNLRLATRSQNAMNTRRHKDNKSGFKGVKLVHFWQATIQVNGKEKYLGSFKTAEAAHAAYVRAARELYGEFANAGHR